MTAGPATPAGATRDVRISLFGSGEEAARQREVRLCLLGFGSVARALCELLAAQERVLAERHGLRVLIAAVGTRHGSVLDPAGMAPAEVLAAVGHRPAPPQAVRPAPELLAASGADVLVELTVMGDLSGVAAGAASYTPGATGHVLEAFRLGMDVVTANKGPIAWSWPEVVAAAAAAGRRIRFESTVMDGLPLFSLLEYTLPDCTLLGFEAVFNATTNFIIDAMGTGRSFEDALAQVQAEGYAEADPSNDVDGWDAASKAAALANVAMGAGITPADVERESLSDVPLERIVRAREQGRRLRLVSRVWRETGGPWRRFAARPGGRRPRPRPPARRGARHRAPARSRERRVARRAAPHRPHGRRTGQRAARTRASDCLRRVRGPAAPVPDELTGRPDSGESAFFPPSSPPVAAPAAPPVTAAPPPMTAPPAVAAGSRPSRRPSWLRLALVSLVIIAAGAALGAAGYRYERTHSIQPPAIERTGDGWTITGHQGREFSGLGLSGPRLVWQDGASIEYADLIDGTVRLLGPGAGMHTTWDPAIGPRYAVWFEAERQASVAAQAVAYDTETGRRWTVADAGSVRSYPAISGDVAVWCSATQLGVPSINGVRVGSGESFGVAAGSGAPVVSGGLVVWATSWTGPFVAGNVSGGSTWPVTAGLSDGRLTGIALTGRTLVWGQAATAGGTGVVAAVDVDGGGTTTLARGMTGLAGPAYDGRTVVWAEMTPTGSRVLGRRLDGGPAFPVADVDGDVTEVAVSGDTVALILSSGETFSIITTRLPR